MKKLVSILFFIFITLNASAQFDTLIFRNSLTVNIKKTETKVFVGSFNWSNNNSIFFFNNNLTQFDSIIAPSILNYYFDSFYALTDNIIFAHYSSTNYPRSIIRKTTDGGQNWETVFASNSNMRFNSFMMSDENNGVICGNKLNVERKIYFTHDGWQTVDSLPAFPYSMDLFQVENHFQNSHFLISSSSGWIFTKDGFNTHSIISFPNVNNIRSGRIVNQDTLLFTSVVFNTNSAVYTYSFDGGENFNFTELPSNFGGGLIGNANYFNGKFYIVAPAGTPNGTRILISENNFNGMDIVAIPNSSTQQIIEFINDSISLVAGRSNIIFKWNMSSYTGLTNLEAKPSVKIFPNPANDMLNVETVSNEHIKNISLFNAQGQEVKNLNLNSASNTAIDVSNFSKGIYFIRISTNNKMFHFKFIKN